MWYNLIGIYVWFCIVKKFVEIEMRWLLIVNLVVGVEIIVVI